MKATDSKALEKRYYAGESSLEEEALLRAYWQEQGHPVEAVLAAYFEAQQQIKLPEAATQQIQEQLKKKAARRRRYAPLSIAAGFLVLLTSWFLFSPSQQPLENSFPLAENTHWEAYEITDPVLAAAILEENLRSLAHGWKQGQQSATTAFIQGKKLEKP